jgi:hypothetical protein
MTSISLAAGAPVSRRRRLPRPNPRNLVVPATMALLAIALVLIALRGESRETLPVDVRVISSSDPLTLGATTAAQVELTNRGDHEVRPRFSLSWLPYPYYWRVVSGPPVLAAGQRAVYQIEAPDSVAAPHDGQTFQIKVNDARSITYAVSDKIEKQKNDLPVVNPGLRSWTQRDYSTGTLSPVGWQMYERRGDGDTTTVEPASVFGVEATHFRVIQDGQPDRNGWSHTGLIQEVPFPELPFSVQVLSRAPFRAAGGGWPLTAFGMEVTDSRNGLLWLLFQPTGNGDREYDLPSGHHIVVYDVPQAQWASRTIDLPQLYHKLNWAPSKKVTLKLFIAASSSQATDIDGYIAGMKLTTDTAGRTSTAAH